MVKNIIFALLILMGLSSCNSQFDRVPGVIYEEIPGGITGNYLMFSNKKRSDTARIEITKKYIISKETNKKTDTLEVHKNFEFSSFDKYLFLSLTEDEKVYQISKIDLKKNHIEMKSVFVENVSDKNKLSKYFKYTQEVRNGDTITIYQMNEKALLKYFKKHVKRKNAQKIYKIK